MKKIGLAGLLLAAIIYGFLQLGTSHAAASVSADAVHSGYNGYCLDNSHSKLVAGNPLDLWGCNGTAAQNWTYSAALLKQAGSWCATAPDNGSPAGSPITLETCTGDATQIWLRDASGYFNPASQSCLMADSGSGGAKLEMSSCSNLSTAAGIWKVSGTNAGTACSGSEGQLVACNAERQWTIWQSGTPSHETLLNSYTDGAPYEAWCADFVSYIYKQSGYPFTAAYDGWDENDANNLQADTGFVEHPADGSYLPKAGDIAYFDYSGGHVEIVISGGKNPTFIYGNSATIDPSTGNGQMETNTKRSDGTAGQLMYYLSPN
jgi:hypothetical protein